MSVISREPYLAEVSVEPSSEQMPLEHLQRLGTLGVLTEELIREVQQSLTVISNYANGCAHRLGKGKISTDEMSSLMAEMSTAAMRTNDVLRTAKQYCRQQSADVRMLDINQLIVDATAMIQSEADENQIAVELQLQRDLPEVSVDSQQLSQVLINLLANGIDALAEWPGRRLLTVETELTNNGEYVQCIVSDSGLGIPAALHSRVFTPFFSTKPEKLGLGLVLCQSIIERHGGRLWLASAERAGTQFHFAIPATGQDSLGQG